MTNSGVLNSRCTLGPVALAFKSLNFGGLILLALAMLPLVPIFGHRTRRVVRWWHGRALAALGVRLTVSGTTPIQPVMIAVNHCSWLDIVVLGHIFDTVFISKAEVSRWPVVGRFARAAGTLFLPRGAGQTEAMTARVRAVLTDNRSVILFPEATTCRAPTPARFHARLFAAAVDSQTPVLPIALRYADAQTPKDQHQAMVPWVGTPLLSNFIAILRQRRITAEVRLCEVVSPLGYDRGGLAEASRQAIARRQALSECDLNAPS